MGAGGGGGGVETNGVLTRQAIGSQRRKVCVCVCVGGGGGGYRLRPLRFGERPFLLDKDRLGDALQL